MTAGNDPGSFVIGTSPGTLGDSLTQINVWGLINSLLVQDVAEPVSFALFSLGAFATMGLRGAVTRRLATKVKATLAWHGPRDSVPCSVTPLAIRLPLRDPTTHRKSIKQVRVR